MPRIANIAALKHDGLARASSGEAAWHHFLM
jgi:hypothetical protein